MTVSDIYQGNGNYDASKMFDENPDTIWHSNGRSLSTVDILFNENINFKELRLQTRRGFGNRYKNTCLYADSNLVYCTDW